MKHSLRRPGKRFERWLLAVTTATLAVSGGTVGHQITQGDQAPAVAAGTATVASAPASGVGSTAGGRAADQAAGSGVSSTRVGSSVPGAPAAPSDGAVTTTGSAAGAGKASGTTSEVSAAGKTKSTAAGRTKSTTTAPAPGTTTGTPTATATASPSTSQTSSSSPTATATATATATGSSGNPLAGRTFYGPNTGAAAAAASGSYSAADTALLSELAGNPTATWLGSWSGDVAQTVRSVVSAAGSAGAVPVLVAYNVPDTDCGGYSAGGATSPTAYGQWIKGVADGIGRAEAVVVLEPDALSQLCGDPAQRYAMLGSAIDVLEANPGTHTYLDAGHSNWISAPEMASRLRAAGIADADGFSLNVSNFQTTASNVTYGRAVSAALGGAHFVIDTSRNGNGPGSDWCNPPGRAVGEHPTTLTGDTLVDAFLWVKRPGESDGTCNGGPSAGTFWAQYAIGLMRN